MREIKFRAWDKLTKQMIVTGFHVFGEYTLFNLIEQYLSENDPDKIGGLLRLNDVEIMQFTSIKDKKGTDIYEGDILRIRRPKRSSQVHTGDNIPLGRCEEPLEPEIEEEIFEVKFENGCFVIGDSGDFLCWNIRVYDLQSAIEEFSGHWPNLGNWGGEDGDLAYLLETYNLKTENDLLAYLGTEVIGNIFQNSELIKSK